MMPTVDTTRDLRGSSARWTRPGLARKVARLAAVIAAVPVLELLADAAGRIAGVRRAPAFFADTQGALLFLIAGFVAVVSAGLNGFAWRRIARPSLRVDEGGVCLVGVRRTAQLAFDSIREGLVAYTEDGASLVLELIDGARVDVAMNEDDARAVLAALRLEPKSKRVTVRVGSPSRPLVLGGLGIVLAPIALALSWSVMPYSWMLASDGAHIPLVLGVFMVVGLLLARLEAPAEITIGTDGIRVSRRLRQRFIPYSRLESSGVSGKTLIFSFRLATGDTGRLRWIFIEGATAEQAIGTHRRIEAARSGSADGETREALVMLDPRGKTVEAWMATLRDQADPRRTTYRRSTLSADSLLDVLGRPDADIHWRIGAAVALRLGDHEEAAKRIRLVAASVASDDARAALESLATNESLSAEVVAMALRRAGSTP